MTLKSDISDMTITVPARQFAHILALATNYAVIRQHLKDTEAKLVRMRGVLATYTEIFEKRNAEKRNAKEYVTPPAAVDFLTDNPPLANLSEPASGAGASVEPQTNNGLTNETEGRGSGGERATSNTTTEEAE